VYATERLPPAARPKLSYALESPPFDILLPPMISDDSRHVVPIGIWGLERAEMGETSEESQVEFDTG